jgi:hypothetical protein
VVCSANVPGPVKPWDLVEAGSLLHAADVVCGHRVNTVRKQGHETLLSFILPSCPFSVDFGGQCLNISPLLRSSLAVSTQVPLRYVDARFPRRFTSPVLIILTFRTRSLHAPGISSCQRAESMRGRRNLPISYEQPNYTQAPWR